jgi:pilus assembly protein Flp/PilA
MVMLFFKREEGQGLVEYALILGLVALVVVGIVTLIGESTSGMYNDYLIRAMEGR